MICSPVVIVILLLVFLTHHMACLELFYAFKVQVTQEEEEEKLSKT